MKRALPSRVMWLQTVMIATVVLALGAGGVFIWNLHQRAQSQLSEIEPRFARLSGLAERHAEMKAMSTQVSQRIATKAYPATQDLTQVGNDAQQRIRGLFADSKLDIISVQVLPPKEEGKFDRISIDLRVEGDLTSLQNALSLIAAQTPLVVMESMSVQTIGAVRPASAQRLGGQFNFTVYRVRA